MEKMNRKIDIEKMNESKMRTMDIVMDRIESKTKKRSFRVLKPAIGLITTLAIVLVVILTNSPNIDNDNPFEPSAFEAQKIAEISYLSSKIVGSNISVSDSNIFTLANFEEDETEFETNSDEINLYFDMLKVFLEEDTFSESVTVTQLEDQEFDILLEFEDNGLSYQFYLTISEEDIIGELVIDDTIYQVTGKFKESENETKIELIASNNNDYVSITYITESEDEVESKFEINQRINGVESEKEIKISRSSDESKIDIKDGDNEYTLKKEMENNEVKYKLEYKINGVEGEAKISENVDDEGNISYNYQISENGKEKEINSNKPDYDHDNSNNGNNGNRQNESNEEESKNTINYI